MRFCTLFSACLLALPLTACNDAPTQMETLDENGAPVTQEDLTARQAMAKGKLAEVSVGDGKIIFYELGSGDVYVAKEFPIGSAEPSAPNEDDLTLAELYAFYAPGQPIPQRIIDASARAAEPQMSTEVAEGSTTAANSESSRGCATTGSTGGLVSTQQAVTGPSSIDETWFRNTYCTYSRGNETVCFPLAYQGAYSWRPSTHTTKGGLCGDTGAANLQMHVDNALHISQYVAYGGCYSVVHHHSHNWLGMKNRATVKYSCSWAEQTIRFFAHYTDGDCYIM